MSDFGKDGKDNRTPDFQARRDGHEKIFGKKLCANDGCLKNRVKGLSQCQEHFDLYQKSFREWAKVVMKSD